VVGLSSSKRHKELADFLKIRRLRLSPLAAGLTAPSARRRIHGLRREEVAALSGVSLAWYTYLEQGRPIRVSEQVLESLARTLQMDGDERNYLFSLASQWLVKEPVQIQEETVSPSLQYMLDELKACPAYIVGGRWEIVAWNRMACEVFGDYSAMDHLGRNLIWRMFADAEHRRLFADWESAAKRLLAQFRNYYGKNIENPWYNEMVEKLKETSPEFREWWQQHEVFGIPEGKKEIRHPRVGLLTLEYNSLLIAEDPDLMLTVFTPDFQTDTKEKLNALIGHTIGK
jgi:transcriptional regulator with XRE-family HTH domain